MIDQPSKIPFSHHPFFPLPLPSCCKNKICSFSQKRLVGSGFSHRQECPFFFSARKKQCLQSVVCLVENRVNFVDQFPHWLVITILKALLGLFHVWALVYIYRVVAIIRRNSSGVSKNELYEISKAPSDPPGLGLDPQQFSLTYHP